jgi:hypothetical protein
MRESRDVYGGFRGEKDLLEDSDLFGRIILRRIFRKCGVKAWTGSI